jgi:hypothetical protein
MQKERNPEGSLGHARYSDPMMNSSGKKEAPKRVRKPLRYPHFMIVNSINSSDRPGKELRRDEWWERNLKGSVCTWLITTKVRMCHTVLVVSKSKIIGQTERGE